MNQYFATLPTEELYPQLAERIKRFNQDVNASGLAEKWRTSEDLYFGRHQGERGFGASTLNEAGDVGELSTFGVNHYRNLIKHVLAMTCSQKPSFEPRAINSDTEAIQQTRLAGNIIDAYMTEKRLDRHLRSAAERSLVYGKAFLYLHWDKYAGKPTMPKVDAEGNITGIIYEGDVSAVPLSPWDKIYDIRVRDYPKRKWDIIRTYENKWDLAARYPQYKNQIEKLGAQDDLNDLMFRRTSSNEQLQLEDLIPVYHFYHLETESVKGGRYTCFLNGKITLEDGQSPSECYKKTLPCFRITPGEIFDTGEGYTEAFDIMVLQQVINICYNIPFNNQQAFGMQTIWMPDTCEISTTQIGRGLAILKGGPPGSQPVPLQLTATPQEIFKNIESLERVMEKLEGLNSVVTGDPEHGLKSGVALGRMQAMAIQYNSNFQGSWSHLNEDAGTFLLANIKDNAKTERIAALAGKHNKGTMVSYTGADINLIERVVVDLGNPMTRTSAGRIEMAENLLAKGALTAEQYIQVMTTGQLDSELEGKNAQKELMRKENEQLLEGIPVRAIVGDKHLVHMTEHLSVIADPQLRTKAASGDQMAEAILQATLKHIQEHKELYQTQEPIFSAIAGEQPAPPPPMPMGPPQGPGGPQGPPLEMQGPPPPQQGGPNDPNAQIPPR